MSNSGSDDRFKSQMFESGNQLRFERPVDDASRDWWLNRFYDTFGLTPEGMADRITRSAPGAKSTVYHFIDGTQQAFSLRVDGDFPGTQEYWYAHRSLDLKGSAFNADGMLISLNKQGEGYGRALMGDLIDTGRLIGVEAIRLRAEQIGRYAWIKMGFLPTADAWMQMKREALSFILDHDRHLGMLANELLRRVHGGGPDTARMLASLENPVPSRDIPSRFEPKQIPFGRAFFLEAASPWNGWLDLRDQETMDLVASYRGKE
jgi:GNAT superfamily N-acetyltransferase